MRAIATRDRTVAELRSCLEHKRVDPADIDAAVAELSEAGLLDDARYARRFAEDKRELQRWGSERIERDLRRRGIAQELIEAALGPQDHSREVASAVTLLSERFGALRDDRQRDRAWRLLIRRGYEAEVAYEAVRVLGRSAIA